MKGLDPLTLLLGAVALLGAGGVAVAAAGRRPWEPYLDLVSRWAAEYDVSPRLIVSIGMVESRFNPRAVNSEAARDAKIGRDSDSIGIMQILYPDTAQALRPGITRDALFDPSTNLQLGAKLLAELIRRYGAGADFPARIASAYNAGRPITGNAAYVEKVRAQWDSLEGIA